MASTGSCQLMASLDLGEDTTGETKQQHMGGTSGTGCRVLWFLTSCYTREDSPSSLAMPNLGRSSLGLGKKETPLSSGDGVG